MKKNLFITLMLVLLALPLASCGNDDEPKMIDGTEGEYTATITPMTRVSETGEEYVWVSIVSCPTSVLNNKIAQYPRQDHLLLINQRCLQGREMVIGDEIHFKLLSFKEYMGLDSFKYMKTCWEGIIELI